MQIRPPYWAGAPQNWQEYTAGHILLEAWKDEAEEEILDHYHWINNTCRLFLLPARRFDIDETGIFMRI